MTPPTARVQTTFPFLLAPTPPNISGLSYLPRYIDQALEEQIVREIDAATWDTTWDRRRQPYGAAYGGKEGALRPIPHWGLELAQRMFEEGLSERPFDQMLVNEYFPGQGIALHHDYLTFDKTVASLSLLSPIVMDFYEPQSDHRESWLLEPRSLLVMTDDARYKWQHGIARRKTDQWQGTVVHRGRRISVTFRLSLTK